MEIEDEVKKEFSVFHKQVDMFEYQKKALPKGRCFSFEMPNPFMTQGRRKFFVAELGKFWFWYRNLYRLPRHFYEIIQEGLPCRLYFDLEYKKADNPDLEENKALSDFLQFVCSMVKEVYKLDITEKSFILLESTTSEKFSVHATCHFPNNYLFPNNVAMREFIAKLTERMSDTGIGIVKKENEETFICDPAVYTKNRSFRILLSSKCKKEIIFKYRPGCQFYDEIPRDDRQIFMDSLVVPPDFSNAPILKIVETKGRVLKRNRMCPTVSTRPISDFTEVMDYETLDAGVPPSFLPELDEYVREFNTQFNRAVGIRSWILLRLKCNGSLRIQYQLNNCRYCLRIQREHVSNNVYWTCQIDREWMFQRCFDYDCREFVSNYFPLPMALLEEIKPKLDSYISKKPMAPPTVIHASKFKAEIKLPSIPITIEDSFNDSALDHQVEAALERKRKHAVSSQPLPKIPKKSIDSFNVTDDKIFQLFEDKKKNNDTASIFKEIMEKQKNQTQTAPTLIDLTDDTEVVPNASKSKPSKSTTRKSKTAIKKPTKVSPTAAKKPPKVSPRFLSSSSANAEKKSTLKISPGILSLFQSKQQTSNGKINAPEMFQKKKTPKKPIEIDITNDDEDNENLFKNQTPCAKKKKKKFSMSPDIFA